MLSNVASQMRPVISVRWALGEQGSGLVYLCIPMPDT